MSPETISSFIDANRNDSSAMFSVGVSTDAINALEARLQVRLPESYQWFLRTYETTWMFGFEVLGTCTNGAPDGNVVGYTERYRSQGMQLRYIVIEWVDEYARCLDTASGDENDCPVISWGPDGVGATPYADGFYAFLYDALTEAKENWEE